MAHNMQPSTQLHGTNLSSTTVRVDRSDVKSNPSEKLEELEQIEDDAERTADIFIAEQKRCASEYRARTARLESVLSSLGLNRAELNEMPKCSAANAASVRVACRGDDIEDEISFSEDALKSAAEARAERSLSAEVRRVVHRTSRLGEEISSFRKVVEAQLQLKPADSMDVREWQVEAAQVEEKAKILRRRLDSLKAPTQSNLQKRYDECIALKEKLSVAQQRLKKFEGLPPSLAEAALKLNEVRKELDNVSLELKNYHARSYGIKS